MSFTRRSMRERILMVNLYYKYANFADVDWRWPEHLSTPPPNSGAIKAAVTNFSERNTAEDWLQLSETRKKFPNFRLQNVHWALWRSHVIALMIILYNVQLLWLPSSKISRIFQEHSKSTELHLHEEHSYFWATLYLCHHAHTSKFCFSTLLQISARFLSCFVRWCLLVYVA